MIKKDLSLKEEPEIVYPKKRKSFLEKIIEDSEKTFINLIERSKLSVDYSMK